LTLDGTSTKALVRSSEFIATSNAGGGATKVLELVLYHDRADLEAHEFLHRKAVLLMCELKCMPRQPA